MLSIHLRISLLLGDSFTFLYVDDIRTPQEIYIQVATAYNGDSFTFLQITS
jgi:hypothetical protein